MTLSRRIPLGSTKPMKTRYNEGEQKLAKRLGGLRRPGSGAIDAMKGDVATKDFLIDQKVTQFTSYRITGGTLNKITFEARQQNLHPAIVLQLEVAPSTPNEWALIPLEVFEKYREAVDVVRAYREKEKEREGEPSEIEEAIPERKDTKYGETKNATTGIRFTY